MASKIVLFLAAVLAASQAVCQSVDWTNHVVWHGYDGANGESGLLTARGGELTTNPLKPASAPPASLSLPGDAVFDIASVVPATDRFLVAGQASGHAYIAEVGFSAGALILLQHRIYPGLDIREIIFSPVMASIVICDASQSALSSGSWFPGLPLPTSFTVLTDAAQSGSNGLIELHLLGWRLVSRGSDLFLGRVNGVGVERFSEAGGVWSMSTHPEEAWSSSPGGPPYSVSSPLLTEDTGPVTVKGPAGSFTVVDEDSSLTVYSGVIGATEEETIPAGQISMVPGHRHRISGGAGQSDVFFPARRLGDSTKEFGWFVGIPFADANQNCVGSERFTFFCSWGWETPGPHPQHLDSVYLLLAVDAQNNPIPVIPGTPLVLDPGAILGPQVVETGPDHNHAIAAFPIPIPNDPTLAGLMAYGQFISETPTQQPAVSSIVGVVIRANEAGAGGMLRTSSSRSHGEAVKRWMDDLRDPHNWRSYRKWLRRSGR